MSSQLPPYVLQELPDITEALYYPLKSVQRIKYTCFDVSKSLIVFGATSGGIYIFNRSTCEFLQLIPNKDGAVTRLAISPDEQHIGFANGRGTVTVTECSNSSTGSHSSVTSKEHQNNEVTALSWCCNNIIFIGDDVGRISVLQLQSFIAKTFQSSSQMIMSLDSRICQLDVKDCMLLVSTYTRCYVCDITQEQYRQIGQKLRDGEFGACFVNKELHVDADTTQSTIQDYTELKQYNIVANESGFSVNEKLANTLIYCARPSSRLWEATIDGTVKRTHQFKEVLAKQSMKAITSDSYTNENVSMDNSTDDCEKQSVNFSKIYSVNSAIFSFKRDALYFLNIENVNSTVWFDLYNDIVECKVHHDTIYVWLANGSLMNLKFMKLDKFLLKCFTDEKFVLCAEFCALYKDYLLNNDIPADLHILTGLREKLNGDVINNIGDIIDRFDNLKLNDATQTKSGIYVVDNAYYTQSSLDNVACSSHERRFAPLSPDAIQAFKDLSVTVSDKLNTSKKILKEKLGSLEERMKHLGNEKQPLQEVNLPNRISQERQISVEYTPIVNDNNIVYKESSQKAIVIDNNVQDKDKVCKALYQYFRLSLVGKEMEQMNLVTTMESYACDINEIYQLMLSLTEYCVSVGALEESKFAPNNIFLTYLSLSSQKSELLSSIINDEVLYKYFVDSCIAVNMKTQQLNAGCECGFPLPYGRMNQAPVFSALIDEFMEKQWSSPSREQCYEMCKKMPYLWRKILLLRRNEDLMNLLKLLLQIFDESLLNTFLPQFTLETWDKTISLYSTLHANLCLNCGRTFENISICEVLDWNDLGALILKSIGGKNTVTVMRKHGEYVYYGELSMKFYHTCLLVAMYENYDATITCRLTDALYSSYDFEEARLQILQVLKNYYVPEKRNTALPIVVAANTTHWGLQPLTFQKDNAESSTGKCKTKYSSLKDIVAHLTMVSKDVTDCALCGIELGNQVLIKDGGLWVFKCGHIFHGECLVIHKIKLCPSCTVTMCI